MKSKNLSNSFLKASLYVIIFLALVLIKACGKKVEPTVIPADASFVVSVDFKSLSSKAIDWKDMFSVDFLRKMMEDTPEDADLTAQLLHSGFDYQRTVYVFGKLDGNRKELYAGATFGIADAKKFENALKADKKNKFEIKSEGKVKFATANKTVIVWEGKNGLFVGGDMSADVLKSIADKIRKTSKSESLENKNTEFRALLQKKYDIAFWIDYSKAYAASAELLNDLGDAQVIKDMTKLTKDVTGTIVFEKGKIDFKYNALFDKEIFNKYQDVFKTSVDGSLISATPIKSPNAFMTMGVGMKGLKRVLDEAGALKDAKSASGFVGLSVDEVFDMLSGDLVIAYKDANLKSAVPDVNFAIGLGINNKAVLDKLLSAIDGFPFFKKKNDHYLIQVYGTDIYLIEKDKTLFVTMTESIKNNFIKGTEKLDSKFVSLGKSSVTAFSMDIQKTAEPFWDLGRDSEESRVGKEIIKEFGVFEAKSTISGSNSETEGFLSLTNKNKNSFAILIEVSKKAAEAAKKAEQKRKKEEAEWERKMSEEESFDNAEEAPEPETEQ